GPDEPRRLPAVAAGRPRAADARAPGGGGLRSGARGPPARHDDGAPVRPRPAVLAGDLLAAACSGERKEAVETEAKVPVTVAPPRRGALVAHIRATGPVDPAPGADWTVTAPQAARLAELPWATGDKVRKGAVLVRFDAPSLRA